MNAKNAIVIVGAQWGDEGKGKVVDLFTEEAQIVIRYAGGANAGHTLYVGNDKVVMRLLPSGILREGVPCVLGQGMVIDPNALVSELSELAARGRHAAKDLVVSDRAHLLFSYHQLVDGLREKASGGAIGTTKRGIGPAYEDKVARRGVRLGLLRHPDKLRAAVAAALEGWAPTILGLGGEVPSVDSVVDPVMRASETLLPLLRETSLLVDDALRAGKKALFEGAQGTLLDVDHGTYPYVTSSSAIAGGACTGVGVGPTRIGDVIGISKAYTTRVGGGPFPTELLSDAGEKLRQAGGEFGAVTGRPRRTGWIDLPGLRYAARVNGLTGLALTKLDVLSCMDQIDVCVAYDTPHGRTPHLPVDSLEDGDVVKPVYQTFEGWKVSIEAARSLAELPAAARKYVDFLEEHIGVPLSLVSVGPRRNETIVLRSPFTS